MEKKLLTKGSFVEVKSDDEGFKGAWYVATVVGSPSRSPSKKYRLLIEYETLFQDDDGSKPLREIVDMSHVRPVPPMSKSNQSFELNEVVDAFYRDGWWAGVITKVHEESRYSVFFENPPEETEFDSSNLRPHHEWVDGNWIRAQKQSIIQLDFSARKEAEVYFENSDVWFPATVLKEIKNSTFLVEVKRSIYNGDGEAGTSNVIVDSVHIRPSPPRLEDRKYDLLDKVDALYDFGWRRGVIIKILTDRNYLVSFNRLKNQKEFNHSQLRLHMEWIDGKWVSGSEEVSNTLCSSKIELATQLGKKTPLTNSRKNQREESNICDTTPSSMNSTNRKMKKMTVTTLESRLSQPKKRTKQLTSTDDESTPSHLKKRLKGGNARESTLSLLNDILFDTSTAKVDSALNNVIASSLKEPADGDQPPYTTEISSSRENVKTDTPNSQTCEVRRRRGRPPKSQSKSPQVSLKAYNRDGDLNGIKEFVQKECVKGEVESEYEGSRKLISISRELSDDPLTAKDIENTPGSSKNFATQLGKKLPPANTMKNQGEEPNSCSRETFSSARNSREKKMKQMTLTRNDSTPRHTTKKRTTQMSPSSNVSTPLQPEDIKGGDATECTLSQLSNIAVELLNGRVDCGFNTITSTCPKQPVGSKTKIDFQQEILELQKANTPSDKMGESKRRGRPPKIKDKTTQAPVPDKKLDGVVDGIEVSVTVEGCQKLDSNLKDSLTNPVTDKIMEAKQQEEKNLQINVKKRGRPSKLLTKRPKASTAAGNNEAKGAESTSKEVAGKDDATTGVNLQSNAVAQEMKEETASGLTKLPVPEREKLPNEQLLEKPLENHELWRGERLSINLNNEPSTQDFEDASAEKANEAIEANSLLKEVEVAITASSNCLDDNANNSNEAGDLKQCFEKRLIQEDNLKLPFMKSSSIWQTIEMMEIFKLIPQKPHFLPLESCKEEYREGLAIGYMITFSSLVEKIAKLQLGDPKTIFDSCLETLIELEKHGFNVEAVRIRLYELVSLKEKQGQLQDESNEAASQLTERIEEKKKIDDEIVELEKKIKDLEEKRALAVSMNWIKDSEIERLRSRVDMMGEGIRSARLDFERLAAASWE